MEHDQAHAAEHALVYLLDNFVRDVVVGHVAPPEEHVRSIQYLIRKPVLGLVEGCRTDLEAALGQHDGEDCVHAFWVDLRDLLVALLVPVLVPDGYAQLFNQVYIPSISGFVHRPLAALRSTASSTAWQRQPSSNVGAGLFPALIPSIRSLMVWTNVCS